MLEGFDPNPLQEVDGARQASVQLLNLVEDLASDNCALRAEQRRWAAAWQPQVDSP